jgi:aminoglycoside 6'-N-acetyltransferase I
MSVKSIVIEHFTHGPISEHFKKHGTIFLDKNSTNIVSTYYGTAEIKKFTLGDIDECVELYKDVFSSDPWKDDWISIDQVRTYFNELIENPVFEGFVAYEKSKLVGACFGHKRSWWTGNDFFIDELFVANEMQGNGIGTKLLDYVECNRATDDCNRLILLTNIDLPAKEFYLKKGFKTNNNRIIMDKKIV